MREFTRILCAVDYSDRSGRALECALWWARWHGADLSVLHVHEQAEAASDPGVTGADAAIATPAPLVRPAPLSPQERDAMVEALEAFVARHRTEGVQVELLLEEATRVADAVLARADALACDLIVMSLAGGLSASDEQPAVGRETAAVMRGASCAFLGVPAPAPGRANPCLAGLRRIVCPASFSETSRPALVLAGELAARATAHLAVVHVVELSEVAASAYDFDAYREARIEPARLQLTRLVSDTLGDSAAVEEILMTGAADKEILKTLHDQEADLLVLGAGVGQVSPGAGGTLEKVARETSCPMLVAGAGAPVAGPDQAGTAQPVDAAP